MTYATQQDLIDRFGEEELLQLADRDQDGVIDAEVVNAALAAADRTIDSYVGKRYALPLNPVPEILSDLAADLARFKLYKDAPLEIVADNHKAAIARLRDFADGKAVLDAAGTEPATASGGVQHSAPDRIFTGDSLKDFTG